MEHHNWGKTSKKRMQGVNPILLEFADRLLKASPYDLTVPWMGGLRTTEDQREIYDRGASKCDGTNKKSYHQSGNALDICIYGKKIAQMYDKDKLNEIGKIGESIWIDMNSEGKLEVYKPVWGGKWKFYDPVHWELRKR